MRNLDSLPFDVLFEVARYLSLDDVVALGFTSRRLRAMVRREETLCRMVVQNNAPLAREALIASHAERSASREAATASSQYGKRPSQEQQPTPSQRQLYTYCATLQNIYARRAAFASASPRSACVVDYAADFLYREGVLCYVYSQPSSSSDGNKDAVKIRILNVEDGGRELAIFDVRAIAQSVVESEEESGETNGDDDDGSTKRERQGGREELPCSYAEEDAEMPCGEMARRAAATLGFEAPLLDDMDASSSAGSRSASPCSLASITANRAGTSSSSSPSTTFPLPRVTLVHYSASILSLYLNFSSSRASPSAPTFLKHHPHYLVAIRLANISNSSAPIRDFRVFRLRNRLGGYGNDDDVSDDFFGSDNDSGGANSTTSISSEGEGDGAGRGLKLFVRNTEAYYYFGTHTGRGRRGRRVWEVHGVTLKENMPLKISNDEKISTTKRNQKDNAQGDIAKLTLQKVVSTAIGADTCFFIHNGHFYGLTITGCVFPNLSAPANTNMVPQDLLNDPHVSTYTSVRFPLASPTPDALEMGFRVFRRHHGVEGPINDAWTALGWVVDEKSGEARVLEERKEWGQGMGMQISRHSIGGERSWYFGTLGFGETNESSERGDEEEEEEGMEDGSDGPRLDDSSSASAGLAPTVTLHASAGQSSQPRSHSQSQPQPSLSSAFPDPFRPSLLDAFLPDFNVASFDRGRSRPWIRHPRRVHRESLHYATSATKSGDGAEALRSFTLSRTKHRAYNYSAKAFLDLVEDQQCCPDVPCLRLRVGARNERMRHRDGALKVDEGVPEQAEMRRQEEAYVHNRVRMWPPACSGASVDGRGGCHCSQEPHAILNAPLQRCHASPAFGPSQAVDAVAVTEERSVVFLRRPKYGGGTERTGPLVLLSFDQGISAPGLDGLSWKRKQCCSRR